MEKINAIEAYDASTAALIDRMAASVYRIDPNYSDTATFCEYYDYPVAAALNSLLVHTKSAGQRHAKLLLVPADVRLDNKTMKTVLGGKTSFMPAEEAYELTGMASGAVTPVGLVGVVPIYADLGALSQARYIIGGQSRDLKIEVPVEGLSALNVVDAPGLYGF